MHVRRKIELGMALLLILGALVLSRKLSDLTESAGQAEVKKEEARVIVLDPGHGGEDPGKVGVNDALEKDINLQIALRVKKKLEEKGFAVVLTREGDSVPDGKREDMNARVKLINETKPAIAVSIHQNSYTNSSVRGAQVFYHVSSEVSKEAAQCLQEEFWALDEENKREIKANDTYFMLKRTEVPTIIVECGFLSNPEEAENLLTEDYQEQISLAICTGISKWVDKKYK